MAIDIGRDEWQSPKTSLRYALDLEDAKIEVFADDMEYEPLEVTIDIKEDL